MKMTPQTRYANAMLRCETSVKVCQIIENMWQFK
jgi:hypothetical protein